MDKSKWPAWATEEIVIEEYNPEWPIVASELEAELKALHDFSGSQFAHIGSTAVLGLPAKPVIDLLATINSFDDIDSIETALKVNNWYLIPPDLDKRNYRRTFVKVVNERRFAHFHLVLNGTDELEKHVLFRDVLRQNPGITSEYELLKKHLADTHRNDREAYTDAKAAFIKRVLDKYLS